jgi:hypothetical protein
MPNVYEKGDLVTISGAFTTAGGANLDPTTVFCQYKDPTGATTTLTYGVDAALVKDSVGHYHALVDANAVGQWSYRWYSTGTGQTADETFFMVEDSEF